MIASLFGHLLFAASADSPPSPVWIDFETGYQAHYAAKDPSWLDVGLRVEWRERCFVDVAWSSPFGNEVPNLNMASGKQPESNRYGMRGFLGVRSNGAPAWLAVGAGWTFARLDTLGTYVDPRPIVVLEGSGANGKTTSWVWNEPVYHSAPYGMAEAGIGNGWFAFGVRAEYRLGWGIGGFIQIRARPVATNR